MIASAEILFYTLGKEVQRGYVSCLRTHSPQKNEILHQLPFQRVLLPQGLGRGAFIGIYEVGTSVQPNEGLTVEREVRLAWPLTLFSNSQGGS